MKQIQINCYKIKMSTNNPPKESSDNSMTTDNDNELSDTDK